VCFGIVPRGMTAAVGIIQVRALEKDFGTAEWGFAILDSDWEERAVSWRAVVS